MNRGGEVLLMKLLLILLGVALIAAAGVGFYDSLDLLTTQIGLVYAVSAAVAGAAGLVILCLAMVVHRLDGLHAAILRPGDKARRESPANLAPQITIEVEKREPTIEAPAKEEESVAPPLAAEAAPMEQNEAPTAPAETTLVGRYSAGGANYSIFSDGSIEAETDQGAFHFASMSEFKAYVAAKRASSMT
jgi:hypothetical protein